MRNSLLNWFYSWLYNLNSEKPISPHLLYAQKKYQEEWLCDILDEHGSLHELEVLCIGMHIEFRLISAFFQKLMILRQRRPIGKNSIKCSVFQNNNQLVFKGTDAGTAFALVYNSAERTLTEYFSTIMTTNHGLRFSGGMELKVKVNAFDNLWTIISEREVLSDVFERTFSKFGGNHLGDLTIENIHKLSEMNIRSSLYKEGKLKIVSLDKLEIDSTMNLVGLTKISEVQFKSDSDYQKYRAKKTFKEMGTHGFSDD